MTGTYSIIEADVLEALRGMADASCDACLTDPPYGLGTREPSAAEIAAYVLGHAGLDTNGDFMGRRWEIPSVAIWREVLRVCRPGAPVLAFAGAKTSDLMGIGMRAAGLERKDGIEWIQGQGMPKPATTTDRYIDWHLGAEREVVGSRTLTGNAAVSTKDKGGTFGVQVGTVPAKTVAVTAAASPLAKRWAGYGHALRPSHEPVLVCRVPLDGTIAENVITHDVGGYNVPACRVGWNGPEDAAAAAAAAAAGFAGSRARGTARQSQSIGKESRDGTNTYDPASLAGRWTPNVVLVHEPGCERVGRRVGKRKIMGNAGAGKVKAFADGGLTASRAEVAEVAEEWSCVDGCPVKLLAEQSGERPGMSAGGAHREGYGGGMFGGIDSTATARADDGTAARFFPQLQWGPEDTELVSFLYEAKVSRAEREFGCEALPVKSAGDCTERDEGAPGQQHPQAGANRTGGARNHHVSLKPIALTRWLATLILPPPRKDKPRRLLCIYSGAGSEVLGAIRAGWDDVIGIEREPEYVAIARARLARWAEVPAHMDEAEAVREAEKPDERQPSLFDAIGGAR